MKLSIVIVSWNVKDILSDCLNSIIRSSTNFLYEIIVVDNASTDGTAEEIKKRYPNVKLIENKINHGFAAANNQGAAIACGEYLFILNPDTILFKETLYNIVHFLEENPDIAMCGPGILNDDMTRQESVRNFPTWRGAFYRYTILKYLGLFKSQFEIWHNRNFDYDQQTDIQQIIGAAMLIRKNIFEKIGGFDEQFFMYYEEVDLCKRLKDSGFRSVYYPGAKLIHLGGKSAEQIPAQIRFMTLQSLLLYFHKHTGPLLYAVLSILFKLGILSRQLYELIVFFFGYQISLLLKNSKRAAKCSIRYQSAFEFLSKFYLKFLLS